MADTFSEKSIQVEEEEVNYQSLAEVERIIRFKQSYSGGQKSQLKPGQIVSIFLDRKLDNDKYTEIAERHNIPIHCVPPALLAAEMATKLIGSNGKKVSTPEEKRLWDIYSSVGSLETFLANHIESKSKTGYLIQRNPGLLKLFRHLVDGNDIDTYIDNKSFGKNNSRYWLQPIRQSILNASLGRKPPSHNPYILIRIDMLSNYLKHHTNAYGRELGASAHERISRILEYSEHSPDRETAEKLSRIRRFFELAAVLDFYKNSHRERRSDVAYLQLRFPGINIENLEPQTINFISYYTNWFESGDIPPGIRIVAEACIKDEMAKDVFKPIMTKISYTRNSLDCVFTEGLYFLENILATRSAGAANITTLTRNPKKDIKAIFKQLYLERSNQI